MNKRIICLETCLVSVQTPKLTMKIDVLDIYGANQIIVVLAGIHNIDQRVQLYNHLVDNIKVLFALTMIKGVALEWWKMPYDEPIIT